MPAADSPVRRRTVISTIVAVSMLLAIPGAALPAVGVLDMVSRGHALKDVDFLLGSILAVLWLLIAAITYLRKEAGAGGLVAAGVCGAAVGLVGVAFHLGPALSGRDRDDAFILSVTMLPLLAGIGHLVEARRWNARALYVLAPLVAIAGAAASVR